MKTIKKKAKTICIVSQIAIVAAAVLVVFCWVKKLQKVITAKRVED